MEPDWTNFTLFGGQLSGPDVFTTWNTKKVLDFLLEVKKSPEGYGITGEDHIKGVQEAHDNFLMKKKTQSIERPIKLSCHGAIQVIQDFDSAVAYIFSVQAVFASDATSAGDFVPALLVLSKVLRLLTPHVGGNVPSSTCLILRETKGPGSFEGFFGSSLRGSGKSKTQLALSRGRILRTAYPQTTLVDKYKNAVYGSCGETIPFFCTLAQHKGDLKSAPKIQGFAINLKLAVKLPSLDWDQFCEAKIFKEPCDRCLNLLSLRGQDLDSFNCFPKRLVERQRRGLNSISHKDFSKTPQTPH